MTAHHRTPEWARLVRRMRPIIQASLPRPCIDCGRPITPDQKWQVGHVTAVADAQRMGWTRQMIDAPQNLGPSHAKGPHQKACNQIAGGRLGAKRSNKPTTGRLTDW